jgi:hypothetical protein
MGTSSAELQAAIDQNGLTGALELLRDHGFAGNTAALNELMPDIRGLNAILPLLADNSGTLDGIMGRVTNSTGSMGDAFSAVADTDAFKMKKAFADIQVALIQIGAVLLPFAADVAGAIGGLVEWFSKLPAPVQQVAVAFGALAAAVGPVMFLAGSLMKSWGLLNSAFGATLGSTSRVASTLSAIGVAAGVAYAAWKILDEGHLNATGHIDASGDALQRTTEQAWLEAAAAAAAGGEIDSLSVAHQALGQAILEQADDRLSKWFSALNVSGDMALDTLINLKEWGGSNAHAQEFLADALGLTVEQMDLLSSIVHTGFKEGDITQEMRDGLGMTNEQIIAVGGALVGLQGYAIENTGELDDMARASLDATVALGGTGRAAVVAAEGIAGSRLETGNAVDVYEEYIHQLTLIDPAAAAAAVGVGDLGAAVSSSSDAAGMATELWAGYWQAATPPKEFGGEGFARLGGHVSEAVGAITSVAAAQAELQRMASQGIAGNNWVAYAEQISGASRSGNDALTVYKTLFDMLSVGAPDWATVVAGQLGVADGALGKLGIGVEAVAEHLAKAAWPAKELGTAVAGIEGDKAAAGIQKFGDAAGDAAGPVGDLESIVSIMGQALDDAANSADDFRNAVDKVVSPADDLREATRNVWVEMDNMSQALEENGATLDESTEAGRANQEQLEATRDALIQHGAALIENGSSAQDAAADIAYNVTQLNAQWAAAGYTEAQIAALNLAYGLTPEQVNTAIVLAGEAEANRTIDRYNGMLASIPPGMQTYIKALIDQGSYSWANQQLDVLAHPRNVALQVQLYGVNAVNAKLHTLNNAEGGYYPGNTPRLSWIGEGSSDEVILPLDDKARMSKLLSMGEVGPRVAGTMGVGGGGVMMSAASGGGGSTVYHTVNATVNMPPGANGDDVIRALRKWQRQSGPLPLVTR